MKKKKSMEDICVDTISVIVLLLAAIICLYPFIYCFSMSLSGDDAILRRSVKLFPIGFSMESYKLVFTNAKFVRSIGYSVFYTATGIVMQVSGTMLYAYVLSQKKFVFKKFLSVFSLIPMIFGGGMIPYFLTIKSLGLYGTYWALLLPASVSIWNAMIAKTFIRTNIPDELLDAARIDGCGHFSTFFRIVLPLSKTIIAILALWAGVAFWNDYMGPLIYVKADKQPMQVLLATILRSSAAPSGEVVDFFRDQENLVKNSINATRLKYVLIVITSLPIMIIYPFTQKFFVKGVMLGSVKE